MAKHQPVQGQPKRSSTVNLTGAGELDRDSDVPLYFQLAAILKLVLEGGTWEAGTRLASERQLEERFNVSRAVIRPALDLLVGDGAIVRVKGSGAFVAPPRREVRVEGLVRLSLKRQGDLAIAVLGARRRRPDPTVSRFLEIENGQTPVAHVTAAVHGDQPLSFLVHSFSTIVHVPWLLPTMQALEAGAKPPEPCGLDLTRATVTVEHTFFGEWGSSQVGASAGDPALLARIVQFGRIEGSEQELPLEFAHLVYRADGAQLAFELG
jgi:GntR family transcriptional regulator